MKKRVMAILTKLEKIAKYDLQANNNVFCRSGRWMC